MDVSYRDNGFKVVLFSGLLLEHCSGVLTVKSDQKLNCLEC